MRPDGHVPPLDAAPAGLRVMGGPLITPLSTKRGLPPGADIGRNDKRSAPPLPGPPPLEHGGEGEDLAIVRFVKKYGLEFSPPPGA